MRDAVFNMMDWWCQKGIDGFRMDVISLISKVPGLPDGPKAPGAVYGAHDEFTTHGPHVHEYLQEMNRRVLSKYDLLTVGETAGVPVFEMGTAKPLDIARKAIKHAEDYGNDIVIIDTAGRLHIDEQQSREHPSQTDTPQDAGIPLRGEIEV